VAVWKVPEDSGGSNATARILVQSADTSLSDHSDASACILLSGDCDISAGIVLSAARWPLIACAFVDSGGAAVTGLNAGTLALSSFYSSATLTKCILAHHGTKVASLRILLPSAQFDCSPSPGGLYH
jgi:hypothetical protein